MGKGDKKNQVLGDDPLAWLNADTAVDKKISKKKAVKKTAKKAKPENNKSEKGKSAKTKPVVKNKAKKKSATKKPENKTAKKSNRLQLESSVVINKASDLYEALKKLSTSGQDIEIDVSKVEIVDSAILQLLLSFVLSLKEKNIKLTWYKPTEGLLNKASVLGLTEQLGF